MLEIQNNSDLCTIISNKIKEIFAKGVLINNQTLDYINSVFLNPSIDELESILNDDSNCEANCLFELIFFPDELIQVEFESILQNKNLEQNLTNDFCDNDFEKILKNIANLKVKLLFPDKNSITIKLSEDVAEKYLLRLNLQKKINAKIIKAIENFSIQAYSNLETKQFYKNLIKVKLKNARFKYNKNITEFLINCFYKFNNKPSLFWKCFNFILVFLEEINEDADIYNELIKAKKISINNIQKSNSFELLQGKYNMETLIGHGIKSPYINYDDEIEKLYIIDTISLNIFARVWNF